jgi:hypothetical protein
MFTYVKIDPFIHAFTLCVLLRDLEIKYVLQFKPKNELTIHAFTRNYSFLM